MPAVFGFTLGLRTSNLAFGAVSIRCTNYLYFGITIQA